MLLAREWHPVPEEAIERNSHGSVLSWTPEFNSHVLQRAVERDATCIQVHSHGTSAPRRFSADDRNNERRLFPALSRILEPLPTGTLLLGQGDAAGSLWLAGRNEGLSFCRLVIVGPVVDAWQATNTAPDTPPPRGQLAVSLSPSASRAMRSCEARRLR